MPPEPQLPNAAGTEPALLAVAVGAAYRGRAVLHDIDLTVVRGEVVGLLGPNGSGKSTLLRVLAGLLRGYTGAARVEGDEVRELRPRQLSRRLAVVPQESAFAFPWSVLEVVLMGRHPHLEGLAYESAHDVAVAHAALGRCGAEALAARNILELSAGERQRVIFARALAQQPRVLLLDEAGSFLDIRHQVEIYDLVRELASGGVAVLAVLHDLNLAAEYCDRICLLREGSVEATGPTREVFTYANLTRVFATEVYVDLNHLTGTLLVTPLSGRVRRRLEDEKGARQGHDRS